MQSESSFIFHLTYHFYASIYHQRVVRAASSRLQNIPDQSVGALISRSIVYCCAIMDNFKSRSCSDMQPSVKHTTTSLKAISVLPQPQMYCQCFTCAHTLRALCHCQYVDLVCMSSTANVVGSSSCYQYLRCPGPLLPVPVS